MQTIKRTRTVMKYVAQPQEVEEEYEVYEVNGQEFKDKVSAERYEKFSNMIQGKLSSLYSLDDYLMFKVKNKADIEFISNYDCPDYRHKQFMQYNKENIDNLEFPCMIFLKRSIGHGDYDYGSTYTWKRLREIEKSHREYMQEHENFMDEIEKIEETKNKC